LRICFKNLEPCPISIEEKPRNAFVFMPLREDLQDVYSNGIKKTLEDLGWSCGRADEKFDTPEIMCTICKSAQEASLIIADLTGRNPNVFLEVGLAFGLEKYVVLLSQISADIPFDTRTFRTIIYDPVKISDLKGLLGTLVKTIKITPKIPRESPDAQLELARRRRDHSIKIKDEALKPWLTKIEECCNIDVIYSKQMDKMIGVEPRDPTDLEFFDVAESHLETKYPEILEVWNELKLATSVHNQKLAIFLEEIRTLTIEALNIPCQYSNLIRGGMPEEYIMMDRFVKNFYEEMRLRISTEREWSMGKLITNPVMYGTVTFYELEWAGYRLMRVRDKEKVERATLFVDHLIGTPQFLMEVEKLMKSLDEIQEVKRKNFEMKLKEVVKSIELGRLLEGECRFCP
jgi:hypothetical protein